MAQDATIRSIFYARFHDAHGPKVLHQVPEGSIIPCFPSPTSMKEPYFDFQSVSNYLIPSREFCNRPLSICANGYRILGHPVCVTDPEKYERNDFIFNFCIVVDEDAEHDAVRRVVSKLASVFANLEEQNGFLSRDEEGDAVLAAGTEGYGGSKGSKVFAVVEMVFEDLNAVGEAMIPIDMSNTLNLSLFPSRPPPPAIHNHHVPLSVARFTSLQTSAWDLTVQRVIPFIDGINSVARIAVLADVDISLARRAVQHLVYYDCVLLLDIFSFAAVYAPTPTIASFIASPELQDECRTYVASGTSVFGRSSTELLSITSSSHNRYVPPPSLPSRITLIQLYTSLRPSLPLRDFCIAHAPSLRNIDIRRLMTFGVLHSFLYRAHRWAIQPSSSSSSVAAIQAAPTTTTTTPPLPPSAAQAKQPADSEAAYRVAALSSGWRLRNAGSDPNPLPATSSSDTSDPPVNGTVLSNGDGKVVTENKEQEDGEVPVKKSKVVDREVLRFADGAHTLDEACTALRAVEHDVVNRMRGAVAGGGEGVVFLYK